MPLPPQITSFPPPTTPVVLASALSPLHSILFSLPAYSQACLSFPLSPLKISLGEGTRAKAMPWPTWLIRSSGWPKVVLMPGTSDTYCCSDEGDESRKLRGTYEGHGATENSDSSTSAPGNLEMGKQTGAWPLGPSSLLGPARACGLAVPAWFVSRL